MSVFRSQELNIAGKMKILVLKIQDAWITLGFLKKCGFCVSFKAKLTWKRITSQVAIFQS